MIGNYRVEGAEPERFTFPFAAIPNGARVLIYGGGIVGKTYVQEVRRTGYCQVVAVADKCPRVVCGEDVKTIRPEDIFDEEFDYLLIALERQDIAVDVWRGLRSIGIEENKMRWIVPWRKD